MAEPPGWRSRAAIATYVCTGGRPRRSQVYGTRQRFPNVPAESPPIRLAARCSKREYVRAGGESVAGLRVPQQFRTGPGNAAARYGCFSTRAEVEEGRVFRAAGDRNATMRSFLRRLHAHRKVEVLIIRVVIPCVRWSMRVPLLGGVVWSLMHSAWVRLCDRDVSYLSLADWTTGRAT